MASNVNPNQTVLKNVGTGGKGSSATRKMVIILHAEDAPGATCDPGEVSEPTPVNLRMVDDDDDPMIDSAKIVVCQQGTTTNLTREVFWQGPLNCAGGLEPDGSFSDGDIKATVSIPGQPDYEEHLTAKCFK